MAAPPPPNLSSRIELHFECQNLKSMDTLSESDPLIQVEVQTRRGGPWSVLGRTEHLKNQRDPKFSKYITCDFMFEIEQNLRVTCFDLDNETPTLDDDDVVGVHYVPLGMIVGAAPNPYVGQLKQNHGQVSGTVIIRIEEVSTAVDYMVDLKLSARKVDKKDFFSKSDPFFVISRIREDGSKLAVHKSEVIDNTLDPKWKAFQETAQVLCNKDLDRPLDISVTDYDNDGGHDYIGSAMLSVRDMAENASLRTTGAPLISEHKRQKRAKKGKSYDNSGTLIVDHCHLTRVYSFFEYLQGGVEISLMVSIDFTGSNGTPSSPQSLHYCGNPNQPNQYEMAIHSVGDILANYDTDKMFPCWGFGGSINGKTEHCFALNGNPADPEVAGVGGIMSAYRQALNNVGLSGPTLFEPTIRNAAAIANAANRDGYFSKYFILLLLTDGEMMDTAKAIQAIVEASVLPLSIVIVGVGNADFGKMEVLDGDGGRLSHNGRFAERDIVQFVPFRNYLNTVHTDPGALARDTLAEIPGQFLSYVNKHGIKPTPPPPPPAAGNLPAPNVGAPPPPPYAAVQNLHM